MITLDDIVKMTDKERLEKLSAVQINAGALYLLAQKLNEAAQLNNPAMFFATAAHLANVNNLIQESVKRMTQKILLAGQPPNTPLAKA